MEKKRERMAVRSFERFLIQELLFFNVLGDIKKVSKQKKKKTSGLFLSI